MAFQEGSSRRLSPTKPPRFTFADSSRRRRLLEKGHFNDQSLDLPVLPSSPQRSGNVLLYMQSSLETGFRRKGEISKSTCKKQESRERETQKPKCRKFENRQWIRRDPPQRDSVFVGNHPWIASWRGWQLFNLQMQKTNFTRSRCRSCPALEGVNMDLIYCIFHLPHLRALNNLMKVLHLRNKLKTVSCLMGTSTV